MSLEAPEEGAIQVYPAHTSWQDSKTFRSREWKEHTAPRGSTGHFRYRALYSRKSERFYIEIQEKAKAKGWGPSQLVLVREAGKHQYLKRLANRIVNKMHYRSQPLEQGEVRVDPLAIQKGLKNPVERPIRDAQGNLIFHRSLMKVKVEDPEPGRPEYKYKTQYRSAAEFSPISRKTKIRLRKLGSPSEIVDVTDPLEALRHSVGAHGLQQNFWYNHFKGLGPEAVKFGLNLGAVMWATCLMDSTSFPVPNSSKYPLCFQRISEYFTSFQGVMSLGAFVTIHKFAYRKMIESMYLYQSLSGHTRLSDWQVHTKGTHLNAQKLNLGAMVIASMGMHFIHSTLSDPSGRQCAHELLSDGDESLLTLSRQDYMSKTGCKQFLENHFSRESLHQMIGGAVSLVTASVVTNYVNKGLTHVILNLVPGKLKVQIAGHVIRNISLFNFLMVHELIRRPVERTYNHVLRNTYLTDDVEDVREVLEDGFRASWKSEAERVELVDRINGFSTFFEAWQMSVPLKEYYEHYMDWSEKWQKFFVKSTIGKKFAREVVDYLRARVAYKKRAESFGSTTMKTYLDLERYEILSSLHPALHRDVFIKNLAEEWTPAHNAADIYKIAQVLAVVAAVKEEIQVWKKNKSSALVVRSPGMTKLESELEGLDKLLSKNYQEIFDDIQILQKRRENLNQRIGEEQLKILVLKGRASNAANDTPEESEIKEIEKEIAGLELAGQIADDQIQKISASLPVQAEYELVGYLKKMAASAKEQQQRKNNIRGYGWQTDTVKFYRMFFEYLNLPVNLVAGNVYLTSLEKSVGMLTSSIGEEAYKDGFLRSLWLDAVGPTYLQGFSIDNFSDLLLAGQLCGALPEEAVHDRDNFAADFFIPRLIDRYDNPLSQASSSGIDSFFRAALSKLTGLHKMQKDICYHFEKPVMTENGYSIHQSVWKGAAYDQPGLFLALEGLISSDFLEEGYFEQWWEAKIGKHTQSLIERFRDGYHDMLEKTVVPWMGQSHLVVEAEDIGSLKGLHERAFLPRRKVLAGYDLEFRIYAWILKEILKHNLESRGESDRQVVLNKFDELLRELASIYKEMTEKLQGTGKKDDGEIRTLVRDFRSRVWELAEVVRNTKFKEWTVEAQIDFLRGDFTTYGTNEYLDYVATQVGNKLDAIVTDLHLKIHKSIFNGVQHTETSLEDFATQ